MPVINFTRAGEDLIFRTGEKRRIAYLASSDDEFTIGSVSIAIYAADGSILLSGEGSADNRSGRSDECEAFYLWDLAGVAAGDYAFALSVSIGDETFSIGGEAYVLSPASSFDAWALRIRRILADTQLSEESRGLTLRHYRDSALTAVAEYSRVKPQEKLATVTLDGGIDFALPADWVNGFSELRRVEYPIDETDANRHFLPMNCYDADERLGTWRFLDFAGGSGERARLYYTIPHALTDDADTIPEIDAYSVAQYASGDALLKLASLAAGSTAPVIGAEFVNYQEKRREYAAQARELQRQARESWGRGNPASVATWDYLPDHGKAIYLQP